MSTSIVRLPSSPEMPIFSRKKPSFWQRLTSNMPQKIIALVCSLILFVVVLGDRKVEAVFEEIPIELVMPDGYVSLDNQENKVNIVVHGRASALREIQRDDLRGIKLPVPARVGNIQVSLLPDMINLPEGVRVDHFSPAFIGINLETLDSGRFVVSTDNAFKGELFPGYQLGEVKIVPDEIEVSGPKSLIEEMSQLYIEPIDLTGKSSTFTVNRRVILNRIGLNAQETQVAVTVNIVSKSRQQVVLGVPIVPLNIKLNHELVPDKVDLTLIGDEDSLAKIDSSKLFVTVDASGDEEVTHARILSGSDFSVSNLPKGVGFDESKLPSVLFKVWTNPEDKNVDLPVPAEE